jgi:DNA-binding SARP family transcriptional activator
MVERYGAARVRPKAIATVDRMARGGLDALRVRVLGGLTVEGLDERDLGSRKGRMLLKVLVLARGAPVPVDRLADIVWGDDLPTRPTDQVGVLVSRLRGVVGQQRLARSDAGYSLATDWLDVDELQARTTEAMDALASGRFTAARAAADAALALDRGPVLPEEDGEWVHSDRTAVAAMLGAARRTAAEAAAGAGDHGAAGALAEQALVVDPCDESSLRILMRAHVAAGRPGSALEAYVRVRDRLAEDLGVSPTAETETLHDAIVLQRDTAPSVPSLVATDEIDRSLPGRDAELARIRGALTRVAAQRESVLLVVQGEGGIGKSALVRHWLSSLQGTATVLSARCDELGRDLPLQPVADALAASLRRLPAERRAAVLGDDGAALRPLLGAPGASANDDDRQGAPTSVVDADAGRIGIFGALTAVLSRLGDDHPVVLFIDDVHLATRSTKQWLAFARLRVPSLLIVVATRRVDDEIQPDLLINLGPLDVGAVAQIVGADRAQDLHARTGGQPLLLTALADTTGADDVADATDTPAAVAAAVERRVAGLPDGGTVLRAASVLGADIDLDLLAAVLQSSAVSLLPHLEGAEVEGILVEGDGFRFRHELERSALERSLGSTRRALLHRDAARALQVRQTRDPLAIAVHARLGGEAELAIGAYVESARACVERFDLETAEAHLDAALAPRRTPRRPRRGTRCSAASRPRPARARSRRRGGRWRGRARSASPGC